MIFHDARDGHKNRTSGTQPKQMAAVSRWRLNCCQLRSREAPIFDEEKRFPNRMLETLEGRYDGRAPLPNSARPIRVTGSPRGWGRGCKLPSTTNTALLCTIFPLALLFQIPDSVLLWFLYLQPPLLTSPYLTSPHHLFLLLSPRGTARSSAGLQHYCTYYSFVDRLGSSLD